MLKKLLFTPGSAYEGRAGQISLKFFIHLSDNHLGWRRLVWPDPIQI